MKHAAGSENAFFQSDQSCVTTKASQRQTVDDLPQNAVFSQSAHAYLYKIRTHARTHILTRKRNLLHGPFKVSTASMGNEKNDRTCVSNGGCFLHHMGLPREPIGSSLLPRWHCTGLDVVQAPSQVFHRPLVFTVICSGAVRHSGGVTRHSDLIRIKERTLELIPSSRGYNWIIVPCIVYIHA